MRKKHLLKQSVFQAQNKDKSITRNRNCYWAGNELDHLAQLENKAISIISHDTFYGSAVLEIW